MAGATLPPKGQAMRETPPQGIAEVLTHYGAEYVPDGYKWAPMRCPFHDDRSASASVSTERGAFKCHACEAKGDPIALIRWKESCDYPSALEILTGILGDSHPAVSARHARKSRRRVFDEPRPHAGQHSIFSTRVRRRFDAGT
ncbi:CHC2 zinc finger domain-containing protein [Nonomuraea rubra]|uniref:CHC2 zinc finger domain-containing protein n=1 Tax=Nonomuraea rubra TaxID=46180 RepID=UPI0034033F5E